MSADMVPEVTTVQKIHDEVQVLTVLKCIVHVDEERIMKLRKDLPLVHDRFHASFCENSGFAHFLHGEILLALLLVYLPDFAESTLTNAKMIVKA